MAKADHDQMRLTKERERLALTALHEEQGLNASLAAQVSQLQNDLNLAQAELVQVTERWNSAELESSSCTPQMSSNGVRNDWLDEVSRCLPETASVRLQFSKIDARRSHLCRQLPRQDPRTGMGLRSRGVFR